MSGSNVPSWPLPSAYFAPAQFDGSCLVELCQGVQQGGNPSCSSIIALCMSGSTKINADVGGSPDIACGYRSQSVTLANGTQTTIACGLLSLLGNTQVNVNNNVGNIQLQYNGVNGQLNNVPVDNVNNGVSVWPTMALDVTNPQLLSQLTIALDPSSSSSGGSSSNTTSSSSSSSSSSTSSSSSSTTSTSTTPGSSSASPKSSGIKTFSLSGLALVGGLLAPMLFSMVL